MRLLAEVHLREPLYSDAHHTVDGKSIEAVSQLALVTFGDGSGVYLIRYGQDGAELTDTLHANINEAINQARYEYQVAAEDWVILK